MIVLGIDSTAKCASVAVYDGTRTIAEYTVDNGRTQSELLLPMIESMLSHLGLSFSDIGLIGVSVGPGSFTGVRIGVALAKGLAFGRNIPTAAVSTLSALAENLRGTDGLIIPVMDARRGQVYSATFRGTGDELARLTEDAAISIDELGAQIRSLGTGRVYLVGDGYEVARHGLLSLGITPEHTPTGLILQSGGSVARVALDMYGRGEVTTDILLSPTYLRLPQAERERLEREKTNGN